MINYILEDISVSVEPISKKIFELLNDFTNKETNEFILLNLQTTENNPAKGDKIIKIDAIKVKIILY